MRLPAARRYGVGGVIGGAAGADSAGVAGTDSGAAAGAVGAGSGAAAAGAAAAGAGSATGPAAFAAAAATGDARYAPNLPPSVSTTTVSPNAAGELVIRSLEMR